MLKNYRPLNGQYLILLTFGSSPAPRSDLYNAQVELMHRATIDDIAEYFEALDKPDQSLVALAGCFCVVFDKPPSWTYAKTLFTSPTFYDVIMELTPDAVEVRCACAWRATVWAYCCVFPHAIARAAPQPNDSSRPATQVSPRRDSA